MVLCHFLRSRTKADKMVSVKNTVSYCDLRENTKFVNHVQFCKASTWKRSHHGSYLSLTKACHMPILRSKGWDMEYSAGRYNEGRMI